VLVLRLGASARLGRSRAKRQSTLSVRGGLDRVAGCSVLAQGKSLLRVIHFRCHIFTYESLSERLTDADWFDVWVAFWWVLTARK
jgi:hypothetical protein